MKKNAPSADKFCLVLLENNTVGEYFKFQLFKFSPFE